MTRKCNYHPYIDDYMDKIRAGTILASKDILAAMNYIEYKLSSPGIIIDNERIEKAVSIIEKYCSITLVDWELFIIALIHCYHPNDTVVFDEFFLMVGRGNGKNGFISGLSFYLTTHYHGIRGYNVDIIANSEEQAKTSFEDIYEVLELFKSKLKKFFYWTKEVIKNIKTNSYIKFNTSNARTKDGKRSACLIFDEIHEYENYNLIKTFTSGFGKRKHSRTFYITTNGNVREGVLDDKLALAKDILNGTIKDLGMLPLLYHIDDEKEALNPTMWIKANPSLPYFVELQLEMDRVFKLLKYEPHTEEEFYTKRMNWPKSNREIQVTDWDNIAATNRELPVVLKRSCTVGIDYARLTDFASVNFHFRDGNQRYDISHSWLCLQSSDLKRLKIPWQQWADEGLITLVDDVEIKPELLTDYIDQMASQYRIEKVAIDNHRYTLVSEALEKIGFDMKVRKNLKLVRPSDIMQIVPVIESCFVNHYLTWGNNPLLRWATNNTKLIRAGKKQGTDTGNFYYGKIEARSRKTDPFMAFAHSMIIEGEIKGNSKRKTPSIGARAF